MTPTSRNWLDLPTDVTAKILEKLSAIQILLSAQKVCVSWRRICKHSSMWRRIDLSSSIWDHDSDNDGFCFSSLCRHVVSLSDGQLIDFTIELFADDELLHHIAQSSSGLKRLRIISCDGITDNGLIQAVANLPLLEELELTNPFSNFSEEALKAVGKSCPLLNSFKLNTPKRQYYSYASDEQALAIAETMPRLQHLELSRNKLTDYGLQAIRSGCPHLVSLDLHNCYYVKSLNDGNGNGNGNDDDDYDYYDDDVIPDPDYVEFLGTIDTMDFHY